MRLPLLCLLMILLEGCVEDPAIRETRIVAEYMATAHGLRLPEQPEWWLIVTGNACAACNDIVLEQVLTVAASGARLTVITTDRLCRMVGRRLDTVRTARFICDTKGDLKRLDLRTQGVLLIKAAGGRVVERHEIDQQNVGDIPRLVRSR